MAERLTWQGHAGATLDTVNGFTVIDCDACRFKHIVPIPTPALAAISRIGASTPEVTNTAAAAASSVCWLRSASARLVRAGTSPDWLVAATALSSVGHLTKRSAVPYIKRNSDPLQSSVADAPHRLTRRQPISAGEEAREGNVHHE